jgi:hypothetical protein
MILGIFLLVIAAALVLILAGYLFDAELVALAGALTLFGDILFIIVTAGIYAIMHGR